MRSRLADEDARARAFAGLVDRRALDSAYRYATLILGDPTDAEDATHDAALIAWRRFSELRDPDRFDAWFGRILVNTCRDRLRSRRWSVRQIDESDSGGPGDPANAVARRQTLIQAIRVAGRGRGVRARSRSDRFDAPLNDSSRRIVS